MMADASGASRPTPVATHARAVRRNGRDPTREPPLQAVGERRAAVDVEAQHVGAGRARRPPPARARGRRTVVVAPRPRRRRRRRRPARRPTTAPRGPPACRTASSASSSAAAAGSSATAASQNAPQQRHRARVVPDRCADDPAGTGDPHHLPHAGRRVGHEVHDELGSARSNERPRTAAARDRLLDAQAREPRPATRDERRRRIDRRDRSMPSRRTSSDASAPGPHPTSSARCPAATPAASQSARASSGP